jgi:putative copper resistance protein D
MSIDHLAIANRFALYADLLILFGWAAFGLQNRLAVAHNFVAGRGSRRWVAIAALAGLLLSAVGLAETTAAMAGLTITDLDPETVRTVVVGTSFGTAYMLRCMALALVLLASIFVREPVRSLSIITPSSGIAAASLAWGGHAVMDEGAAGWTHLIADIFHLLAAGLWVGALVGLVLLLFRRSGAMNQDHLSLSHRALARFAPTGTLIVALVTVSGLVNAWMLIGPSNVSAIWTTDYGRLLVAKLGLFGLMLALAAMNRFLLTPGLSNAIRKIDQQKAINGLRRSLALETGSAVSILALVAWLGTLEPLASAH